jgi:hypothetical protein
VVRYQRIGTFLGEDAFRFLASDGVFASFEVTVVVDVQPLLTLPFEDDFPDFVFDELKWAEVLGATVDGTGIGEPSPPFAARLNASASVGDVLVTFPVDLGGQSDVRLAYAWQRAGDGDSPETGDDLFIEYMDTNGAWQLFAQYPGDGPDMTEFTQADDPLPADALHGEFQLRLRTQGTSGDDWFVDDVWIYHPDAPVAADLNIVVRRFGWAEITLSATDPTDDPLSYRIVSLPVSGALHDMGDGTLITAAMLPYTLSAGRQVRYQPVLGLTGLDGFAYRASDGVYDSTLDEVAVQIGGEIPIVNFPMDVDPGWSTAGLWAFGQPQGIDFDPTGGATGTNVYGYNLAGKYESNLPPTHLTMPPQDLSLISNAELRFQRWLGVESSFFDHAAVELSTNGVDWSVIWEHDVLAGIFDRAWGPQSIDIAARADGEAAVQLRWVMGATDGSGEFEGWNIDDVAIHGDVLAGPGDIDKDGDVDAADLRAFDACLFGPQAAVLPVAPGEAYPSGLATGTRKISVWSTISVRNGSLPWFSRTRRAK